MPKTDDQDARPATRLLTAAVEVGARDGWSGVTTRAVAAEAGLNPGLVHYHVGSVDALRVAALRHCLAEVAEAAGDLPDDADAAAVAGALLATLASTGSGATAYVYEAFVAARRQPEVAAALSTALRGFRERLAAWLSARGGGDTEPVAVLAVALLDGLYLHRMLDPKLDVEALAAPLARLLTPESAA